MPKNDDSEQFEGNDLSSLIASELSNARQFVTETGEDSATAMEYMRGEMNDVPPRPNGTSVTSNDLSDTISWILPSVIKVFTSSDSMVDYEPVTANDPDQDAKREAAQELATQHTEAQQPVPQHIQEIIDKPTDDELAKQATDYANYVFYKDNDGYKTLYDSTYDSLLDGNGIVRHYWDDTPVTEITTHTGLSDEQLAELIDGEDIEVLTNNVTTEVEEATDPATMETIQVEVNTWDVKIERTVLDGKLVVEAGIPENFYMDGSAIDEQDARFVAYKHENKTRSDLIEMGFDKEQVNLLSAETSLADTEEAVARAGITIGETTTQRSMERLDLFECYIKVDVDNDGIAEMVQAWYVGDVGAGVILDWELWDDDHPYTKISCYPVPHSPTATSVADRTMDIQRIKTHIIRQTLDNMYASNLPMREVEVNSVVNPDILANPIFGGTIWKTKNTSPIVPHVVPYVADKSFGMLEYLDKVVEKRTGVSRATMSLDPDSLQNQTATAAQNMKDASYSQIDLIARNMALYGGWKRVFKQILKLIIKHQDKPRMIRLRGKYVEMDPKSWNADMDATVNVGLGTGSRDRDMAMLGSVLQIQREMAGTMANYGYSDEALEMVGRIINTAQRMAESSGLSNPETYFPDISPEQLQAMKKQAEEKAAQPNPELELKKQEMASKMELERMKGEAQVTREQAQMEADIIVQQTEQSNAMELEREKIASNERIESEKIRFNYDKLNAETGVKVAQIDAQNAKANGTAKTN